MYSIINSIDILNTPAKMLKFTKFNTSRKDIMAEYVSNNIYSLIESKLSNKLDIYSKECPRCKYIIGDDINDINLNDCISMEKYNTEIEKLQNKINELTEELDNIKQAKLQKKRIKLLQEDNEKFNEILYEIVKIHYNELRNKIPTKIFIEIVNQYVISNYSDIIIPELYIYHFMRKICKPTGNVRFKSNNDGRHCFKLSTNLFGIEKIIKDDFQPKDNEYDKYTETFKEFDDEKINNITYEFVEENIGSSGCGNIEIEDIVLLHKNYYINNRCIPERNKTNIIYNDIKLNLERNLKYIQDKYFKFYKLICDYCYNGTIHDDDYEYVKDLIEKMQECINKKILFANMKYYTSNNKESTVYAVLNRMCSKKDNKGIIKILNKYKNDISKFILDNKNAIESNDLYLLQNKSCVRFAFKTR